MLWFSPNMVLYIMAKHLHLFGQETPRRPRNRAVCSDVMMYFFERRSFLPDKLYITVPQACRVSFLYWIHILFNFIFRAPNHNNSCLNALWGNCCKHEPQGSAKFKMFSFRSVVNLQEHFMWRFCAFLLGGVNYNEHVRTRESKLHIVYDLSLFINMTTITHPLK